MGKRQQHRREQEDEAGAFEEQGRREALRSAVIAVGARCFRLAERLRHLAGMVHDAMGETTGGAAADEVAAAAVRLGAAATDAAAVASALHREVGRLDVLTRAREAEEEADELIRPGSVP
jgi:hypothetical protein